MDRVANGLVVLRGELAGERVHSWYSQPHPRFSCLQCQPLETLDSLALLLGGDDLLHEGISQELYQLSGIMGVFCDQKKHHRLVK